MRDYPYYDRRGLYRAWLLGNLATTNDGMDAPAFNGISCAKVEVASNHRARQLDNHEDDVPARDAACETFTLENIGQSEIGVGA
jgi:hypothetical protein